MRELDRLKCIQGLIEKQLKQKAVAERLGLLARAPSGIGASPRAAKVSQTGRRAV
jgi:hypothetical protein